VEEPTLCINPGDALSVAVTNDVLNGSAVEQVSSTAGRCSDLLVTQATLNVHYYGAWSHLPVTRTR
jgi:hypothetical protein